MQVAKRRKLLVALWAVALAGFVALAVRASSGDVLAIDVSIARRLQDGPTALGHLYEVTNWMGREGAIAVITLTCMALLAARRHYYEAAAMAATFLWRASHDGLKALIEEPRPAADLIKVSELRTSFSFPSGHVVGITVVFALIIAFAPLLVRRSVVPAVRLAALAAIVVVGPGRVWVGAHWPSDALGGYLFALLFLIPVVGLRRGAGDSSRREA